MQLKSWGNLSKVDIEITYGCLQIGTLNIVSNTLLPLECFYKFEMNTIQEGSLVINLAQ